MKRARRRGRRGSGSITQLAPGRYVARYSHTEGGVRKREAKTFTLRNDAEWWLSQVARHGEAPADPLLRDYLAGWLRGKRKVKAGTLTQYREHVELHIVPILGGYRLSELRRRHVEAMVERLQTGHLSASTVGKVLTTLRSALEEAVPRDIPDNPAAKVEQPPVQRKRVEAMTPTTAVAILDAVRDTWLEHITRVLLGSGMRLGEAVALNQGDVADGFVSLRESKTTIRAVRLSADADEAIHEAIKRAPRRGRSEPVFFGPRKRKGGGQYDRLHGYSVTRGLPLALERAGLPPLTPHKLRHGTATLMVRAGVSMRAVAEQLGHANPSMTARTYVHVAPESLADAIRVLDDAVSGK